INWCNAMKGQVNEEYGSLQNPEKEILHEGLVNEQGGLCGYTMRRIEVDSSHIEHIKPESMCRMDERGSDLDYENMIACYPREELPVQYQYGAHVKGGWWDDFGSDFISPLRANCEWYFIFNLE